MILKFQNTGLIKSGTAFTYRVHPYIRVKFSQGYTPTMGDSQTLVDAEENIWDITKNSTDWSQLFYLGSNDNTVLEVIEANTSSVTNMSDMFLGCAALTAVPLFDTSSVTNMSRMFRGCRSLTLVPLFDTSSVTNMNNMFAYCTSLTTVPLFNTSSVTGMSGMFANCTSLTSVPLFDTSLVTGMTSTFENCTSLTTVPLFNTSSVTIMNATFADCINLTHIPLFNTSSVKDMSQMFRMCYNVESGALALYQQVAYQADVPYHYDTFYSCGSNTVTGAAELAQIPDEWK